MGNRCTVSSLEGLRTCLNGPWDASEPVTFCTTSQVILLEGVAEVLRTSMRRCQKERWWPAPCPPPALASALQRTDCFKLPVTLLCSANTPGLSADVKMKWELRPQLPPLEEFPLHAEDVPAFWARVEQQPQTFHRRLLVKFFQFRICPDAELEQARQDAWAGRSDRYWEIKKPLKQITLHVGLDGQYEGWHPQDKALWQCLKLQKALRTIEQRRHDPECKKPLPLVALLQQCLRKGDQAGADEVQAVLDSLPAEWERQPWGWLLVWIDPEQTPSK